MSISSAMSGMSVSMHGEEVSLDQAIEGTFKQLQTHLNNTQNNICGLATADDRGDFRYSYELQCKINFSLAEMLILFRDLKSIVKQIKLKPETDEDKEWVQSYEIDFKKQCEEQK
jgi:hypothetical protein